MVLFFTLFVENVLAQREEKALHDKINEDSLKIEMAKAKEENKKRAAKTDFKYLIIKAENNTYGYDIFADGNLYIHQNTIPAVGGNNGFADTTSAGKVARYAIQKIKDGEIPPTISVEELKMLEVY
jgi:hypothetical protein